MGIFLKILHRIVCLVKLDKKNQIPSSLDIYFQNRKDITLVCLLLLCKDQLKKTFITDNNFLSTVVYVPSIVHFCPISNSIL